MDSSWGELGLGFRLWEALQQLVILSWLDWKGLPEGPFATLVRVLYPPGRPNCAGGCDRGMSVHQEWVTGTPQESSLQD